VAVAKQALAFSKLVQRTESVVVNGAPGIVSWRPDGKPMSVLGFVVASARVKEIHVVSNPERVQQLINYRAALFT